MCDPTSTQDVIHLADSRGTNPYSLRSNDVYRLDVKAGSPSDVPSILNFLRSKQSCTDQPKPVDATASTSSASPHAVKIIPIRQTEAQHQQPLTSTISQQSIVQPKQQQQQQTVTPTHSPAHPRVTKLLHAQSATMSRSASLPSTCLFPTPHATIGEKKGLLNQEKYTASASASPVPNPKRRTASAAYSCSRCQRQMSSPMFIQEDGLKTMAFCSFACFNAKNSPR